MGIAGRWPRICEQINFAVASEVVMPRPSWPAATKTDGSSGDGPINGSLSGVAGRKPVHTRIAESELRSGIYSKARCNMRARIDSPTAEFSAPYWRDDPINIWPVFRGCTLKATESAVRECALFK